MEGKDGEGGIRLVVSRPGARKRMDLSFGRRRRLFMPPDAFWCGELKSQLLIQVATHTHEQTDTGIVGYRK